MKNIVNYKLTFLHKFIGITLLVLGVLFLLSPTAYKKTLNYEESGDGLDFLQKGEYVIELYYIAAPRDNAIVFFSDEMLNENNELGKEFLRIDVGTTGGNYRGQLFLDEDVHGFAIRTEMDDEEEYYLKGISIQSVQLENRDHYLLAMTCLLGAFLTFYLGLCVPTKMYIEPVMLLGMAILASVPVFTDFITTGHDLSFHVGRLEALGQGLIAGEFPVYLGSTEMAGFGTLSATMYPQLFLYPIAALRVVNISLMTCYRILIITINIISAFASYYSAKSILGSTKLAFWTSFLYIFSIYRLVNVYLRAAIGESLAMAFLPLVIWGMYEVLWRDEKRWYILALGVGGVLQSHVLSTEMSALFLLVELLVWIISGRGQHYGKRLLAGVKAAVITVLVNAFFLVPFLSFWKEDLQCFHMPNEIAPTGVYFSQMFNLFADYNGWDYPTGGTINEMPMTIGTVFLIGSVLLLFDSIIVGNTNADDEAIRVKNIARRCLIYGVFALFMSSFIFPWDYFQEIEWMKNMVTSIQFAWRFLGPASVLLSYSSAVGIVLFAESHESRKWIYGLTVGLLICSTSYFFSQKNIDDSLFVQYSNKMEFNLVGDTDAMYMYYEGDRFSSLNTQYTWNKAKVLSQMSYPFKVENLERKGMYMKMTVTGDKTLNDKLMFPLYYYPGYVAYIDGKEVPVESLARRVACPMPKGTAEVEVYYKGLPEYKYANCITLLTAAGIIVYLGIIQIRRMKKSTSNGEEDS